MWPIFGTLMLLNSVGASWTGYYDVFLRYADTVADFSEYEAANAPPAFIEDATPTIQHSTTDPRIESLEQTTRRIWQAIDGLQSTLCLLVVCASALLLVQCFRPATNRTPSTRKFALVEPLKTPTKTISPV